MERKKPKIKHSTLSNSHEYGGFEPSIKSLKNVPSLKRTTCALSQFL